MEPGLMTVGQVARQSGLARSTLLYYDRLGLLTPSGRSGSNYRLYRPADLDKLQEIRRYRGMGIPLKQIAEILRDASGQPSAQILRRRLTHLEAEINDLRRQQRCIVDILKQEELHQETEMLTKERWTAVMKAAGMTEDMMHNWHIQFENMEPDAHQEFLESLEIKKKEIDRIRKWSREG